MFDALRNRTNTIAQSVFVSVLVSINCTTV